MQDRVEDVLLHVAGGGVRRKAGSRDTASVLCAMVRLAAAARPVEAIVSAKAEAPIRVVSFTRSNQTVMAILPWLNRDL
jgi:hypothetical protein